MLSLVAAEDALGLNLGGSTSGELLVEADNALHAQGVGSSSDCLIKHIPSANSVPYASQSSFVIDSRPFVRRSSRQSCGYVSDFKFRLYPKEKEKINRTLGEATCSNCQSINVVPAIHVFYRGIGRTLGGMSVDSARLVTKLMMAAVKSDLEKIYPSSCLVTVGTFNGRVFAKWKAEVVDDIADPVPSRPKSTRAHLRRKLRSVPTNQHAPSPGDGT